MDWLKLDIDLPGQEDRLRSFDRRLTDLLRSLDERLEDLERVVSPKPGETGLGEYGGVDTDIGYTSGLGVQIKVKKHTLLYELRWRRTDIPDVWHYQIQADNVFNVQTDDPDNIEVEIRYLPDAFSQWSKWETVQVAPQVHPAEGLAGVGDVNVTVSGNTATVTVDFPQDIAVPKSIGNFGLFIKLAKFDGDTVPTYDTAPFWGTVPYPQNQFTITNLSWNATYYLFIRLATYGNLGGKWEALEVIKEYATVNFTTEFGDARVEVNPVPASSYQLLHSMESTSGWTLSAGSIQAVTNRVEGNYALGFKRPDSTNYITATYTFSSDRSNSGYPVFSCWYYTPASHEQLNYLQFVFKNSSGGTIFTALFNAPQGVGVWRNYRLYVGESSAIRTVEIQFTWKSIRSNWVYLDFLAFYPVNYLPSIDIAMSGGSVGIYPPTGLPGFLSVLEPIKTVANNWASSTTVTVPAGQVYYVLTASLTGSGDTLRIGTSTLNSTYTGASENQVYQVVGSGESIVFTRSAGNCRIIWVEFNLPEFFRWYVDQAITSTSPFPPSDRHVGWIWDWAMTGGASAFRPTTINVNMTTPTDCKRNVFKPWIHWGGFRYLANTGTIYVSGLFAEKEVI
jgi:hypothetical protein